MRQVSPAAALRGGGAPHIGAPQQRRLGRPPWITTATLDANLLYTSSRLRLPSSSFTFTNPSNMSVSTL